MRMTATSVLILTVTAGVFLPRTAIALRPLLLL